MAGILANSASATMLAGDTSADNTRSGYITSEQITLSTTPTGATYQWSLAKPSGATGRSDLSDTESASVAFTPDLAGYYVVECTVDSTTVYVLRISVTQVALTTSYEAIRYSPKADADVPAPAVGETRYFSSTAGRMRAKRSAGTVRDIDPAARAGTFTLTTGAATVADTSVTASTVVTMHCETSSSRGDLTVTLTPGVNFSVSSSNGADASTWRYALIG